MSNCYCCTVALQRVTTVDGKCNENVKILAVICSEIIIEQIFIEEELYSEEHFQSFKAASQILRICL